MMDKVAPALVRSPSVFLTIKDGALAASIKDRSLTRLCAHLAGTESTENIIEHLLDFRFPSWLFSGHLSTELPGFFPVLS